MTTQNWVILTDAQITHAETLDDDENYQIGRRAIDNSNPGVGININPDAGGVVAGEVVTLVGKFVAPKRMVDDVDCVTYAPDLRDYLLTLPWAMLDSDTIFIPQD